MIGMRRGLCAGRSTGPLVVVCLLTAALAAAQTPGPPMSPLPLALGPVGLDASPGPVLITTSPAAAAALGAGARVLLGLSQFLAIGGALVLVISADTYKHRSSIRRHDAVAMLLLLIWFGFTPLVLGRRAVLVPGYLISAGALASAGIAYLDVARRTHLAGAGLLGAALSLLALSQAWIALDTSRGAFAAGIPLVLLIFNALLFLVAALGMHLLVFEDMTHELRVANRQLSTVQEELQQLALTDPLTGCYNRRFFQAVIGRELQRHQRYAIPLALLFIDVDKFKAINDSLGHEVGDRVLQEVAAFITRHVREADYVFRWGGDEFLVLLSCTGDQAERRGVDLKTAFCAAATTAGLPSGVSLSIGCVEAPAAVTDILPLVHLADERMYQDKVGRQAFQRA